MKPRHVNKQHLDPLVMPTGSVSVIGGEMHIDGTTMFAFNSAQEGGAMS